MQQTGTGVSHTHRTTAVAKVTALRAARPCRKQQRAISGSPSRQTRLSCRTAAAAGEAGGRGGNLAQLQQAALNRPEELEWSCATVVENRQAAIHHLCAAWRLPGGAWQPARCAALALHPRCIPHPRRPPSQNLPAPRCREASADGSVRTLLLSVEDAVTFLEGRRVRHVQEKRRWIDDYRCVRVCACLPQRLCCAAVQRVAGGMAVGVGAGTCSSDAPSAGARTSISMCRAAAAHQRRSPPASTCVCYAARLASPAACRVPGQFVAARYCPQASGSSSTDECADLRVAQRLLCLASSPYEARRDSALLDASLVELLVSRAGG